MAVDLIRQECPALEPSEDEDGGELELSLGLPIVGGSRRSAADLGIRSFSSWPSSSPTAPTLPSLLRVDGAEHHAPDPLRRREVRAHRSHGARRKRDEKQHGKGIRRAREDAAAAAAVGVDPELGPVPKQRKQNLDSVPDYPTLIPDSAAKPKAAVAVNPELGPVPKQRKQNLDSVPDYPTLIPAPKANPDSAANPNPKVTHPFPVIAMHYPYPPMQCMPFGDGFGVPFMMPCWAPAVSPVAEGPKPATARNVFQPVACRAFRPAVEPANGSSPARTNSAKSKDGSGAGIGRAPSWTPSQGSSSSPAASDHRSDSAGSLPTVQPGNQGASSRQIGPGLGGAEEPPERRSTTSGDGPISAAAAHGSSPPPPIRPPRPRMPCVSATGDGPSGKRIRGFLYRYTEAEISIVCVCHGSSFSPAEFVKHAGGTDAAHPLRQITVVSC